MGNKAYIYIAVMAVVTFLIRVLPLTLIRKQIKSQFIRSFLFYVPYVTLAVMTFPAMIDATQSSIAGISALLLGIVLAFFDAGLFKVCAASCVVVFILELFLTR